MARVPDLVDFIQANEPRLIAFNEYANDEGTEGRCRPGSPGRRLDGLPHGTHRRACGLPLSIKPYHLGGFTR